MREPQILCGVFSSLIIRSDFARSNLTHQAAKSRVPKWQLYAMSVCSGWASLTWPCRHLLQLRDAEGDLRFGNIPMASGCMFLLRVFFLILSWFSSFQRQELAFLARRRFEERERHIMQKLYCRDLTKDLYEVQMIR